jgi:hypothetical protein
MITIDFATDFSPDPIAQSDTSKDELLSELEAHKITLALGIYMDAIPDLAEADLIYRTNPRRIFDLRIE